VGLVSGFLRGREPGITSPPSLSFCWFICRSSSADPHCASHSEQRERASTSAQLQLQYRRPEESSSHDFGALRPTEPVRNHNCPTMYLEFLLAPLPVLYPTLSCFNHQPAKNNDQLFKGQSVVQVSPARCSGNETAVRSRPHHRFNHKDLTAWSHLTSERMQMESTSHHLS
jgi:hypothetical protein